MTRSPQWKARKLVFGATVDAALDADLDFTCEIDRAHLVMLSETRIISRRHAGDLLREIDNLRACKFAPLRGRNAPRGLYLLYESYLIEQLGPETGGLLHTARSRNDLNATLLLLRLREPFSNLMRNALRLQATLLGRGRHFSSVTMPAYTHYQAAVPITLGHYFIGIASALERDITALEAVAHTLQRCPLGAGALGGTSWPIDTRITATLLGFDEPLRHSIDAIASRDAPLRLLAAAATLSVLLSRLATDILIWSSREFDFIELPDGLVGGSSLMPQKRNAYLLEHVQGRSSAALGAFVAAAAAMNNQPFTNSISAGQEGLVQMWSAINRVSEALVLAQLIVAHIRPHPAAMLERAVIGNTAAAELANHMVRKGKMSFRTAHSAVSDLLRSFATKPREALAESAMRLGEDPSALAGHLDPAAIATSCKYGAGAGSALDIGTALRQRWSIQARQHKERLVKWRVAAAALDDATRSICASTFNKLARSGS